jgi:integrase
MPRAYGSGSKRERRPGVWEIRAAGRSETVRGTAKDAERALARLVTLTGARSVDVHGVTLDELLVKWLDSAPLARNTRSSYETALAHLPGRFRALKLERLSIADFDRLYRDLERRGTGIPTIRKLHTALSSALTEAVRWRWIAMHPARGARLPATSEPVAAEPDVELLRRILDTASANDIQAGVWIRLSLGTGGRRSEVLALRWPQVDLRHDTITIAASLEKDRTRKITKTKRSVRTIPIDPDLVAELHSWRAAQLERALAVGVKLPKDAYVLSNAPDSMTPWRPDGASQRFRRLAARCDAGDITINDLRHAYASMLLRDGVDIVTVSQLLGHARTSTTLNIYAHVIAGADRRAADVIRRRFAAT